jgi:hypothetical protein
MSGAIGSAPSANVDERQSNLGMELAWHFELESESSGADTVQSIVCRNARPELPAVADEAVEQLTGADVDVGAAATE